MRRKTSAPIRYCSVDDVKGLTRVKPKHYFPDSDKKAENKFKELIKDWINLASSAINTYCNTPGFEKDNVPETIRLVCMIAVSNIIAFAQARKDSPIIKVNDWKIDVVNVEILTDELKNMLDPFKEEETVASSSGVDFFAITGD